MVQDTALVAGCQRGVRAVQRVWPPGVDAFGDLFRGVRAQGSLFGSSTLAAPWSLRFVDGAPSTLCTVLEGPGWIVPDGRPPGPLAAGEMVVLRGPAPFSFVDEVGTAAEPVERVRGVNPSELRRCGAQASWTSCAACVSRRS